MRKTVFLLILCILMSSVHIPAAYAAGNTYYVDAVFGNDLNDGTSINSAFKTLLKASSVVEPGDTCIIREGVYRETLYASVRATADKPVTYKTYNNENVVITGGDLITDWQVYNGHIYMAPMHWNITGGNMVFAEGEMCHEARWPNISESFLNIESYATPDSLSGSGEYTITASDIPAGLTNAMLWYNTETAYWSRLAKITANEAGSITFNATNSSNMRPGKDSLFYITRNLSLLDAEYEWYKDEANSILYLYAPGGVNPNTIEVEAKRRENAIDLQNASYVNIQGINVRGAGVLTNENTTHCTLDNMTFESMDYDLQSNAGSCGATGLNINGSYNVIKNSEIKNNYGYGVSLSGNNNAVLNCHIHDINYQHAYSYAISVNGKNHVVRGNELHALGRSAIGGSPKACDISYNDMYDAMRLSKDGGALYLANANFEGTEVHHNVIHDSDGVLGGVQCGIYYDNRCSGIVTYNNVVYGINTLGRADEAAPLMVNNYSNYNVFFNNTLDGTYPVRTGSSAGGLAGNVFINNVFSGETFIENEYEAKGIIYKNNITEGSLNTDYTLPSESSGIDTGMIIPDITVSDKPDCGAYEDNEVWTAGLGALVDAEYIQHYNIPGLNILTENNQFEYGYDGFAIDGGSPEIVTHDSWNFDGYVTRQGAKSARLDTGDSISRRITGLKPNTKYNINIFAKIKGDFHSMDEVTEKSEGLSTTNYKSSTGLIANLYDGAWVKVPNVDFKNGEYNKVELYLNTMKSTGNFTMVLDSLEGETIAEYNRTSNSSAGYWITVDEDLSSVSGTHDVYIKFTGDQSGTFIGGFVLMTTNTDDKVLASVISDSNDYNIEEITATSWEDVPVSITVTTGNLGEAELIIEKKAGTHAVYLDSFSVTENFDGDISSADLKISNVRITDEGNNLLSAFGDDTANLVEFEALNTTASEKTIAVESYYKNGTLFSSTSVLCKTGENKLALGVRVPNEYGQYIEFKAGDEIQHRITLVDLGNQVVDYANIYIKKLWLNNSSGFNNILNGAANSVLMLVKNNTEQDKAAKLILAFYDKNGVLVDTVISDVTFKALSSNYIQTDYMDIEDSAAFGRVFIREGDLITPLTSSFTMD